VSVAEPQPAASLVLIADDEPTSRLLTRQALEHAGFRVAEATNGADAAKEFERLRPDLVLLDVDMPEMDGYSACAAMRGIRGERGIPIVMLTARDDLESINRAYAAGATDFIAKPISWALLGHRARYFLRSSRASLRIERLSRMNAVLSGINSAIVRIRKTQELLDESCRIAVQEGHFAFAWVGMIDAASGEISPVARAGDEQGFLDGARFTIREDEADGQTLVGRVARGALPIVSNDIAGDGLRRGRQALERGFRAVVALPLLVDGACIGVMALYSSMTGVFDEDEMRLLRELAGDVSFGLEYIRKEQKLHHLAFYDALTGLPNRRLFQERLVALTEASRPGARRVVTIILDVRGFQAVNDNLGRHGGDKLLRLIAQRLRETLRASDTLGRVGGDQFGVILTDIGTDAQVAPLLEKILEALAAPFPVDTRGTRILVKAGVTVFPNETDGATAETLLSNAEAALKEAKASPEAYLFYAPHINAANSSRMAMEGRLLQAIEKQLFELHYQPKIDLRSGEMTGVEALLRLNDPESGELLPPYRFVPLLEETGLIVEVGRWLLGRAARDLVRLQAAGHRRLRVSVNLSTVQLRQKDFTAYVTQAVGDAGIDGIDLEITESVLIDDLARHFGILQQVREMGMGVALDDFGTGYSSLSYLSRLPANTLKIDKSFIDDMLMSPGKLAIVAAIISLAHALEMRTVAEGVETEDQVRLLRRLGCDEIQGYLAARPMPVEALEAALRARGSRWMPAGEKPGTTSGPVRIA
jgi:diguanylate cyclase (GGDEF)-like protein